MANQCGHSIHLVRKTSLLGQSSEMKVPPYKMCNRLSLIPAMPNLQLEPQRPLPEPLWREANRLTLARLPQHREAPLDISIANHRLLGPVLCRRHNLDWIKERAKMWLWTRARRHQWQRLECKTKRKGVFWRRKARMKKMRREKSMKLAVRIPLRFLPKLERRQ